MERRFWPAIKIRPYMDYGRTFSRGEIFLRHIGPVGTFGVTGSAHIKIVNRPKCGCMPLSQISRRLTPFLRLHHIPLLKIINTYRYSCLIMARCSQPRGCMVLSSCKSPRSRARQFQYTTVLAFGYYNNGDRSVGNDQQMRSKSRSKGLAQSNVSDCFAQPGWQAN
jgi:hypothetical protein